MPTLTIRSMLPPGERFTVRVDGAERGGDALSVGESFRLELEQARSAASPAGMRGHLLSLLSVLALGGRYTAGAELDSPYRALWSADCALSGDGEIEVWLRGQGPDARFEVLGKNIALTDIRGEALGSRPEKRRWFLGMLPLLLILSAPLLALPCLILTSRFSGVPGGLELFIKLVFTLLPLGMLLYMWGSVLRQLFPSGKARPSGPQKKLKFLTALQVAVLLLFSAAAVSEAVGLYVLGMGEFAFTPFPATVVLIVWYLVTLRLRESLARSGALPPELAASLARVRAQTRWIFAVYGLLLALIVLPTVLNGAMIGN